MREGAAGRGWTVLDARADRGSGAADYRPTRPGRLHATRQDAAGRLVEVSGDRVRVGDLLRARRAGRL